MTGLPAKPLRPPFPRGHREFLVAWVKAQSVFGQISELFKCLKHRMELNCVAKTWVSGGELSHNIIYCNHDKQNQEEKKTKWKMQKAQGIPLHIARICISPVSKIFD